LIHRCIDEPFIRQVTAICWEDIADKDTPKDYQLPDGEYFILSNGNVKSGFVVFLQEDGFKSLHIAVLPEFRGEWVEKAVKACVSEIQGQIKARVRSQKAYALGVRCGFRKTGMDAGQWIDMELIR